MATTVHHRTCYPAVERDDPRFDGQFVTAVLTTGIFCRSVCKAQTPRPENVRFFSTAAAAAEAGFRPCLRCRPESAPDPPLWNSVSPVVSRALQLIGEGVLNGTSVENLARLLNVSNRHLQRLFLDELGTPPIAVAQTRRLLFAKKLIDETSLSMADVAFSAGYSSVRRFNEAIRQTYGRTPTEIRKKRRGAFNKPDGSTIELRLFYREPYNWPAMMEFLAEQATPFVEQVDESIYRRSIRIGQNAGIVEAEPVNGLNAMALRVPVHLSRHLLLISEHIKRIFDLRADPVAVDSHLRDDVFLEPIIQRQPGMRIPGTWTMHELAVRTLLDRSFDENDSRLAMGLIVQTFGEGLAETNNSSLTHTFPDPHTLSHASHAEMKLPERLAESIRGVSCLFDSSGPLAYHNSLDQDVIVAALASTPGIDEQIAWYLLMRSWSLPDVDITTHTAFDESAGFEHISAEHRAGWRPWRSYAAVYTRLGRQTALDHNAPDDMAAVS